MPTYETIIVQVNGPFAFVTLNRPDSKNAMNTQMVVDLLAAFEHLRRDASIRAVVLAGAGGTFCAGGDIKEMASILSGGEDRFSTMLDTLLQAVNEAPQVVIARVEGAALGGGFGLVCVSDIAVASTDAKMGLPEVRLGLVPALISPYVIQRLGLTRARELMLTGRRFTGAEAQAYGVVHEAVATETLDARLSTLLDEIKQCNPQAIAACKALMFRVMGQPLADSVGYRAGLLDELRQSAEGMEGMMAFAQKRKPTWAQDS